MSETAAQGAVAGAPSTTPIASARIDAGWIGVAVAIALGLNLRPILTTIGPLLAEIRAGIGFIITGSIPYAVGWLREVTGGFQMPWLLLIAIVIASMTTTLRFAPSGYARALGQV